MHLNDQQKRARDSFRAFLEEHVTPFADSFDKQERLPVEIIQRLAREKYLGAALPQEFGGKGLDIITYGLLQEELGRSCSSIRSLVTVQSMTAETILRWGNRKQKDRWLPGMATGETIAGFALSEPNAGSDAAGIETIARSSSDHYVLNGAKKWITFGQIANLFLVIAKEDGKPTAFLVEGDNPGLSIEPISGMLGVRASMLASLHLSDCLVHKDNIIGRSGFGLSPVASTALEHGRYCVAWGCVGIAQACLMACAEHVSHRKQFGQHLKDFQLIQQMIANMACSIKAARSLCFYAAHSKLSNNRDAHMDINVAKYFTSRIASQVAADAVQIHGALGCSSASSVQRYFRDAKIMEIIEGSTQIQEITIGEYGLRNNDWLE